MNRDFLVKHWYAAVYEQFENQTNDAEFILKIISERLGSAPRNILEVACGGGRISVPMAQAGHNVTGFDSDEQMLLRCQRRGKGLLTLRCYPADAVSADWGGDFDIVLLGGNILINIETDTDYAAAQELFIRKAARALLPGGHLLLDFDLHCNPEAVFNRIGRSSYFEGGDELGTYGRTVSFGSVYDPVTQICAGASHIELITGTGEEIVYPTHWRKHIPTQSQVYQWIGAAGLEIERTYSDYTGAPVPCPAAKRCRATVWARKI